MELLRTSSRDVRTSSREIRAASRESHRGHQEHIFVAGGFDGSRAHAQTEMLPVQVSMWSEQDFAAGLSTLTSRWGCTALGFVAHDLVVLFGGFDGSSYSNSTEVIYTEEALSVVEGPEMLKPRAGAAIAELDENRALLIGGYKESSCEVFDVSEGGSTWACSLPSALAGAAAVALGEAWQSQILIVGGYSGLNARPSAGTLLVQTQDEHGDPLDPSALWVKPGPPMLEARGGCAAVLVNDEFVIVVGGFDGHKRLSSTEVLDLETMTFAAGPSMATPRSGASIVLSGSEGHERPLVIGGYDGSTYLQSTEVLIGMGGDEGHGQHFEPGPSLMRPRSNAAATVVMLPIPKSK